MSASDSNRGVNRHFVFLQGMPSPFFTRVAQGLTAQGYKTTGVNFCAGDSWVWRGPHRLDYRGRLADWAAFFEAFCQREQITDLVLLGEQRRYHKEAVAVAQCIGIRVMVTDFGYLRPDWITLERDGMSGNSHFPRDINAIKQLAALAPEVDLSPRYADSFWNMARADLIYSFSNVFLGWLYPHYRRSDNRPPSLIYFPAMGLRLLRSHLSSEARQQGKRDFLAKKLRYFLFPLQLAHDFQLVAYSDFAHLSDAIALVLRSFAAHRDVQDYLVVKVHPWDPGLYNWQRLVKQLAQALDVADFVLYLDVDTLDDLIPHAVGMVTVNSTSGVRALQLGCPVVTLGQAVYDVPGLTFEHGLDRFWRETAAPEPALVDAFIRAIVANIQIRGVFFDEPGLGVAVETTVNRLIDMRDLTRAV